MNVTTADRRAAAELRIALAHPMTPRKTKLFKLVIRRFHRAGCNCNSRATRYAAHHWACGVNRA